MITGWHYNNIYETAEIGDGTKIGSYVEVGEKVKIGKNCIISSYVFIPEGVEIGNNVFLGPHCCFANDKKPPSPKDLWSKTIVEDDVSIGMNATILPGITIGQGAIIGAGAVVVKDVEPNTTVVGNPAHKI